MYPLGIQTYARGIQDMFSGNQQILLTLFITNPTKEYHLHEIGRIIEKKPGSFQKGLNALERDGILKSRMRGNQRLVSLNKQHPLLNEIKKIIQKTVGVEIILKELVESIEEIQIAYIFGSYAKNRMRSDSDIDLIIVGKRDVEDEILEKIDKIEQIIQREINFRFYPVKEYSQKIKQNNAFLKEILDDRCILLKGEI